MSIRERSSTSPHPIPPQLSEALSEPAFLRALCLERKRAERSQRPFVLMLVELNKASHGHESGLLHKAASVLFGSIRATDTAGWYADGRVFAVLFAELGQINKQSALTALRSRISSALQSGLGPAQLSHLGIAFHYFPEDSGAEAEDPSPIPALYPDLAQRDDTRRLSRVVKRVIDIVGSIVALTLLVPLFLVIAIAVKVSSPGPVLYRQRRIGWHGVPFTFFKFRSMQASNDPGQHREFVTQFISGAIPSAATGQNGHHVYKITSDSRITGVGRILRRTSLDELPQLFNVLRGEMSLVGPRPPIPYELEAYRTWHRRRVLEIKPGITGLWQVNGRSRLSFDDMVRLDLRYAQRWSLWLDLKILLRTPRAIVSGEGAY